MKRVRRIFNRHNAWTGIKALSLFIGVIAVIGGLLGMAATLFGMWVFQLANLGGAAIREIVEPIADTGEIGLGVSLGLITLGVALLR